jgi:hypothetical protein
VDNFVDKIFFCAPKIIVRVNLATPFFSKKIKGNYFISLEKIKNTLEK